MFTRQDMERAERQLLNAGRWGNARVWRVLMEDGDWVVKDFSRCPPVLRSLWGAWMVRRELAALERLKGIRGVPPDPFRVDRLAFAYRFTPATLMRETPPSRLNAPFFRELEALVLALHERQIAHLDLRYRRNLLVDEGGHPLLIDFQSHMPLERLPGWLRRRLCRADLSGVYKHWCRHAPETLDEERLRLLWSENRWRQLWILKGYGIRIGRKRRQRYEEMLAQRLKGDG
jgi:RIO-like serine/threonine protein kinase